MKHIPALFSTPMVQAIQNDTKTITRRTGGLEKINEDPNNWVYHRFYNGYAKFTEKHNALNEVYVKCPFGEIGDILWVREAFYGGYEFDEKGNINDDAIYLYWYMADDPDYQRPFDLSDAFCINEWGLSNKNIWPKWKPSIHMPKEACRLWLEKTATRVERLHDITETDAIAEGIERSHKMELYKLYGSDVFTINPVSSFKSLWIKINGQASWDANPYVWVNSFKKVEKPAGWPAQ